MPLSQLFLFFMAYSVIGWITEVVYCSVQERRLVNRGFLHGPLCPVYGFGALLVVFLLEPFSGSVLVLFLVGMALTTALEYITAWLLETAFSTRWWDYSDLPFNFRGRVCLLNSVLFGLMSLIGVRVLHP
ncbi:MAG TPA: putative ABC transporter permease, partial [Treponemataceae bacterium]|nr:putative ABC transporter permease [Treponemataceae bacterium]